MDKSRYFFCSDGWYSRLDLLAKKVGYSKELMRDFIAYAMIVYPELEQDEGFRMAEEASLRKAFEKVRSVDLNDMYEVLAKQSYPEFEIELTEEDEEELLELGFGADNGKEPHVTVISSPLLKNEPPKPELSISSSEAQRKIQAFCEWCPISSQELLQAITDYLTKYPSKIGSEGQKNLSKRFLSACVRNSPKIADKLPQKEK